MSDKFILALSRVRRAITKQLGECENVAQKQTLLQVTRDAVNEFEAKLLGDKPARDEPTELGEFGKRRANGNAATV